MLRRHFYVRFRTNSSCFQPILEMLSHDYNLSLPNVMLSRILLLSWIYCTRNMYKHRSELMWDSISVKHCRSGRQVYSSGLR